MSLIQVKRTIRQGFINFWRNGWVSVATVLIMVLTLFMVGTLFFSNVVLTSALQQVESKLDVSVDFKLDAPEEDILALKTSLESFGEVGKVEYISRDEALERFRERYKDNALITQSLDEIGTNPLPASFNIKAKDPENYGTISSFLKNDSSFQIIDEIRENQPTIDAINSMISSARTSGLTSTIVLSIIAVLVAFNTIRLAIYTSRDEISIMRLVGASHSYIRAPFVVVGIIQGFLASIAAMVILWLPLWFNHDNVLLSFVPIFPFANGSSASESLGGPNLLNYYFSNFIFIFLLLLASGIILGSISSIIATRRYLKEHK
ncbi:hypothetical protein A3B18_02560 [Candidatus Giovannonibacteria bacterium RIFCSPLOWO2_01_FULL_46_13]|uniref:Cell division protein FtsX n=1 Tax=Candidatus Giovannonibacteria bacterium RIFCSPLOWO2_01_FULL_46_13 TaxID=1798352 RepID=A0A1F5X5A3_9BACT|nr:MAG: hypothetical protein A3B18_02560 [Candidatus Giovannonibacteria bacterium RIFCSPLOWO2_01_FULL_46_13]